MHGVQFGVSRPPLSLKLGLPEVKTIDDMRDLLKKEVQKHPPGTWIRGTGWQLPSLGRLPRKEDFDDISPDHPIIFIDFTLHSIVVNSKALEVCGINANTPDPYKGHMERDPETGEPTGVFQELVAQSMIMKHMPPLTDEELKIAINYTQQVLNQNGVTSYNDSVLGPGGDVFFGGAWGTRAIHVYKQMQEAGELNCRVTVGLYLGNEYGEQDYDSVVKCFETLELPEITDKNWLNIPMFKIFADGIPPDRSSFMRDNYLGYDHSGSLGLPGATPEEQADTLFKLIKLAHSKGYQVAIHATGDRATDLCLEGFIAAIEEYPRQPLRHYVIHGDFIDGTWAQKAAKYNIGLSSQPSNGAFVMDFCEQIVGEKARRMMGFRELIDAGLNIAGGSDCPVASENWRKGVQACVTRKSAVSGRIFAPELAISVEEALRIWTINGAYQEHMETSRGSIEIGKVADFQVLAEDLLTIDKDEIGDVPVELTVVGGKVVYSAE
jgi:predicted amidohydrolase YtcJ